MLMHKDAGKENKYFSVHTIGRDNPEKIEKKFKWPTVICVLLRHIYSHIHAIAAPL